jgi:TonB family protein
MRATIDPEIERLVDRRLGATRPVATPRPVRRIAPIHFSPLLADAPPAARRARKLLVIVSVAVHVVLGVVVVLMPRRARSIDEPPLPFEIVFTAEAPSIPETRYVPTPARPAPKPKPKPEPREEPIAATPKPLPAPEPPPPPVVTTKVEPPKPRPEVKVGLLDEGPSGPALVASRTSRSSVVIGAGVDGSAGNAATTARPGRVVEAAFDASPAKAKTRGASAAGAVQSTAFDEAAAPHKREASPEPPARAHDTEVEILSKPKPAYTEEARALHLEGDVLLDVTFEASGTLRVLGVASGLGHGLDEAAIDAAQKIRFHPAQRDGMPVDHTARLRVVFRLA